MKINLKTITTIQTGFFGRPSAKGKVLYLQTKDFDENALLKASLYPVLDFECKNEKHLLLNKDILFAAKGSKNFAALYESKKLSAVASTSFFVIRLLEKYINKVLPEYLVWFINHPNSQKILKGQAIGTSIVSISKTVLEELEISIPSIDIQKIILKIADLHSKEKKMNQQIEILREKQIQQQIINAIK